jgi:hypothetical protein
MSVLQCDRNGCDNIMCDILIDNRYCCSECWAEFEEKISGRGRHTVFSFERLYEDFTVFMDSPKIKPMGIGQYGTLSEFLLAANRQKS